MYKICFFDIDGTLVNDKKQVTKATRESLQQLKQAGMEVVLATGRPPYHFAAIAAQLEINAYVSFNGAYVKYQNDYVQGKSLDEKDLGALVSLSHQNQHPLLFSSATQSVSNVSNHPDVLQTFEDLQLDYVPVCRPHYWKETPLFQAMLYCKAQDERFYLKHLPGLSFVRWHDLALDVMPKDISKAAGVHAMLDYLGILPEEALAFGDGLNDKEMLSFVGTGIAMGNAHKELRPYADMITKTNEEDGITHALRELGLVSL
ncbi:Cof-type HAD-IIB family hydrolase [Salibacterium aidingense]|uniref:Cof-type HAD-IIB family hydrolase n=1 Tax=Salibacterium aidingense TaxID=384933 RepID=UPI003BCAA44D